MKNNNNLHAMHRQRLKNRALKEGLDNFEPHNVLELMLFFVLPHVDTNDIAHELINYFGSFDAVFQAPIEELMKVSGIKQHAATFIKLIPEFMRYYAIGHGAPENAKLGFEQIKEVLKQYFVGVSKENVVCMFFDNNGYVIYTKTIFYGSIDDVAFSYRELVNEALSLNAFKIVIAHNHPSNSPLPSPNDISTYKKLKGSLAQVNIELIDSFIITKDSCIGTDEFIKSSQNKKYPI